MVRAKHMAIIILRVQQYSRKREAVVQVATQPYIQADTRGATYGDY